MFQWELKKRGEFFLGMDFSNLEMSVFAIIAAEIQAIGHTLCEKAKKPTVVNFVTGKSSHKFNNFQQPRANLVLDRGIQSWT